MSQVNSIITCEWVVDNFQAVRKAAVRSLPAANGSNPLRLIKLRKAGQPTEADWKKKRTKRSRGSRGRAFIIPLSPNALLFFYFGLNYLRSTCVSLLLNLNLSFDPYAGHRRGHIFPFRSSEA